jgi:glutathione S-transferase
MQRYLQSVEVVDNALDGKTFLLGDKFSAADIMVGSTLMWIPDALLDFPCLQEYVNRLKERDAFIRATKD